MNTVYDTKNNTVVKQLLTQSQKEWLIDWVSPNKMIPKECAEVQVDNTRNFILKQLQGIRIYPQQLPKFKTMLKNKYYTTRINPGDTIGISCAQSIGEKQTQSALNSFHHIGVTAKLVTTGTPRINELLNITKFPKEKTCYIKFNKRYDSIQSLRETIGCTISHFNLGKLITREYYSPGPGKDSTATDPPKWLQVWSIINDQDLDLIISKDYIRYTLDTDIMYKYMITKDIICEALNKEYKTIQVVPGPGIIKDIYVFLHPQANKSDIDCIHTYYTKILKATNICGIPGIDNMYYTKTNGDWCLETDGTNLPEILGHPIVDEVNTYSNYVWENYNTLGIEAVRNYLIFEFMTLMSGINYSHVKIICDRMTWKGKLESISRYTMRKDENPLLRCSFEECMHNFITAATQCEDDLTKGVSSSIILGKLSKIGTGFIDLQVDMNKLYGR